MVQKFLAIILLAIAAVAQAQPIVTDSTSRSVSTSASTSETTVSSPPPTAVAPAITVINSDVCSVGYSGAAQTQVLGISFGGTATDKNCERLKLARSIYDMGMKVAAVAVMCQDERVFTAMMNAGTPCPVDGKIGDQAKTIWDADAARQPQKVKSKE